MKPILIGGLAALLTCVSVASLAAGISAEDQIKYRKANFNVAAWNMGKIKEQVIDKSVAYDQAQVQAAANAIAAVSHSGLGSLFGPGTDKAVGDQKTRAKPELFQNIPEVARLSQNFAKAADGLVAQAATGDQAAIRTAFGEVGDTCKACHTKFRAK
ncbi:MAG: Cytochrome c' [Stenotrophomonas maltophilia]|nr:MAG: Cytochrome c' [Stenotrophomonas maltophilia]